ncbi:MAG: hypothetical protein AB7O21_01735 [Gammaproteobacteria bacterium]
MAGEYDVARACVEQALAQAARHDGMSEDAMCNALLGTLIGVMAKGRTRKDLMSFIEFQIEAIGEDEFVITRGC